MKKAIIEFAAAVFLWLGFFVAGRPILSIVCFLIFAVLGTIAVYLEDRKERSIFRK